MRLVRSNLMTAQLALAVTVTLLAYSSACFIRNCPIGGKRSVDELSERSPQRKCLSCGPSKLGQCLGPNICCGREFGCHMNTAETAICARENEIPTPCEVQGEACGAVKSGRCVADAICCNEVSCKLASQCKTAGHSNRNPMDTLQFLKKLLLQQKAFEDGR